MEQTKIGLVGNPNSGKTTLFNALTGANQRVGNWPGVTVERKEGRYQAHGQTVTVVDLPGVYSVDAEESSTGLDELVARDYLLSGEADVIINIVDASNLERNLYLTTHVYLSCHFGGLWLSGSGRFRDGSPDAVDWATREILCADDGGVWLQHPRYHGHPNSGKSP